MQNDDKSKLEERVIAYFDGSLDSEGSRSLLREVAESPEKRALFKAHESLSRLIMAARTPMEAPLEVRRSIAERIPGMLAFIPGLLGTAETAPIISQNANPFLAFFARMSLTTAVSIVSAIILLTTGVLLKNTIESHSVTPKIVDVQSLPTTNAGLMPQSSFGIPPFQMTDESHRTDKIHTVSGTLHSATPPVAASLSHNDKDVNANFANMTQPMSAMPVSPAPTDIPTRRAESLLPLPLVTNEGITIRPYVSTGARYVTLNGINGPSTVKPFPSYLLGLEFDLGDRYAFRVQGGKSSFATLTNDPSSQKIASIPVYQARVTAQSEAWSTVGISYSFPIVKSMPLIVSADGGAVFFSKPGVIGMLGASTEISLFQQFLLRPSVSYDAVWTSLPGVASSTGNAIYANPVNQSSMLSTGVGFNISLMYRP